MKSNGILALFTALALIFSTACRQGEPEQPDNPTENNGNENGGSENGGSENGGENGNENGGGSENGGGELPDKTIGIWTAEDLVNFAKGWNEGSVPERFDPDKDGIYKLEDDIDLSGIEWTPIGMPKAAAAIPYNTSTGLDNAFTGIFDGCGHRISNLGLVVDIQNTQVCGLFGSIENATVRNLVIENATMGVRGKGISSSHVALGFVTGMITDSTIENVTVTGTIDGASTSTASRNVAVGGIAGLVLSTNSSKISNCTFGGAIKLDIGEKYSNTNTVEIAGIAGAVSSSGKLTRIENCTNNAAITVKSHRAAGIVGNAFRVVVDSCNNNGTIECDYSADYVSNNISGVRIGGIMAYCSTQSDVGQNIVNCTNNGLVSTQESGSVAGGVCGLIKCYKVSGCTNKGNVIAPEGTRGLLVGILQESTTQSTFDNCSITGKIGARKDGSDAVESTTGNYLRLGASFAAGVSCSTYNSSNVHYIGNIDKPDDQGQEDNPGVKLPEMTQALPSLWVYSSSTASSTDLWTSSLACSPATDGTAGLIRTFRGSANTSTAIKHSVTSNKPYAKVLVQGDWVEFDFAAGTLNKGDRIQFNATLQPAGNNSHKYWLLEWQEAGQWKSNQSLTYSASEDASIKYTARLYYNSSYQTSTINQIITLDNAVSDTLKIRLLAVGKYTSSGGTESITNSSAAVYLPQFGFSAAYCNRLPATTAKSSHKVLCIGNSFSYYSHPVWKLQEIAASQGHSIDIQCHLKGSQTLENHCSLVMTTDAIDKAGYDFAFIQDQSQNPAKFAQDPTTNAAVNTNCKKLADKVRAKSPSCKVILENTWAFSSGTYGGFSSYANFDALLASGTKTMAQNASTYISPIGQAFALCRSTYPSINLYHTDNKHQSPAGAYLKACVNYLVLFGEKFDSNAPDCGLDSTTAARLREIAETTVLGSEYVIK